MAPSLYDVLEVAPTASTDEIRRQYKKLALKYHPDKNVGGNREHAEKMFKAVAKAYEVLSDEAARREYDRQQCGGGDEDCTRGATASRSTYTTRRPHQTSQQREAAFSHAGPFGSGFRSAFSFDDDPFFSGASLFGGNRGAVGGSSPAARQRSSFFDTFFFRDPFELFEEMMRDDMFTSRGFASAHPQQQSHGPRSLFGSHLSAMSSMMSLLDAEDPFESFGLGPSLFSGGRHSSLSHPPLGAAAPRGLLLGGSGGHSSASSFFSNGPVTRMQSVSTVTEIRNGQRVTKTIRRTQDERGIVTEDVDEEVERLPPATHPALHSSLHRSLPHHDASYGGSGHYGHSSDHHYVKANSPGVPPAQRHAALPPATGSAHHRLPPPPVSVPINEPIKFQSRRY